MSPECNPHTSIPDLSAPLVEADLLPADSHIRWSGPRHWWRGPLDAEGLALGSVGLAGAAIQHLSQGRRRLTMRSENVAASFDSFSHLRIDGMQPQGFAELSGFHPTSDGWIRVHANYPHHAARLLKACRTTSYDGVRTALSRMSSAHAEAVICSHGGVAAAVRHRTQWTRSPQGRATRGESWITMDTSAPVTTSRRWTPRPSARFPLEGLRILDLTRVMAGPSASRLLAALGADVLRLDPPGVPELRDQHVDTGFGKRSAVGDLAEAETLSRVHGLLDDADVLLLGYRRGSLERFGLAPHDVADRHRHVVTVSLDAWGGRGPWAGRRGFDSIVQAAVGIADVYASEDGTPGVLPVQALDHATGYGMVAATAALLARRARGEGGGHASLSLTRTADLLLSLPVSDGPGEELPRVRPVTVDSPYGDLTYVPPPVHLDRMPLGYPHPPHLYGSDRLEWQPSTTH